MGPLQQKIFFGSVEKVNSKMISIEQYRAAIGRRNSCKQLKNRHDSYDIACIIDFIKALCFMTIVGIPLYFLFLTLVCIITPHFTMLMFMCIYINSLTKGFNQTSVHASHMKTYSDSHQLSFIE